VSMKVLIVDSDWYFVSQASGILESKGHQVSSEADSAEAFERAEQLRPDVILINVELEEVCQGDMLERLEGILPRPAIVLVSVLERFDKAWQAWQRGGHEVLFKPILHPSELHVAILNARQNALNPQRRPAAQRLARSA